MENIVLITFGATVLISIIIGFIIIITNRK